MVCSTIKLHFLDKQAGNFPAVDPEGVHFFIFIGYFEKSRVN